MLVITTQNTLIILILHHSKVNELFSNNTARCDYSETNEHHRMLQIHQIQSSINPIQYSFIKKMTKCVQYTILIWNLTVIISHCDNRRSVILVVCVWELVTLLRFVMKRSSVVLGSCRQIYQVAAPCSGARGEACCVCHEFLWRRSGENLWNRSPKAIAGSLIIAWCYTATPVGHSRQVVPTPTSKQGTNTSRQQ